MNFNAKVIISINQVMISEGDGNAISRFSSTACERA